MRLEDYGFVGDTRSGALIGANGSIDWFCVPRFDSAACFAALLGSEDNGFWRIAPKGFKGNGVQSYQEDTMVLETLFETDSGAVRLIDFMPPRGKFRDLVRIVEGVRGEVEMEMHAKARFDYGHVVPWVKREPEGLTGIAGPDALVLRTNVETVGEGLSTAAHFRVAQGDRKWFLLTWHPSHLPMPEAIDVDHALFDTQQYWRSWAGQCTYRGPWRKQVMRSLLTLKALTYSPTGGIMAALTTSLPEKLGGVRNWDYRFCWLRDATFTLYSFMMSGYMEEASAWSNWLLRAVAGDPGKLQIMYGAAGERRLSEFELPHLPGYENSSPVRIGNAASQQFQLDVYGEVIDAMYVGRTLKINHSADHWHLERHLIDFVIENWTKPDEGIWEIRGPQRHFTHSKVMAWVAIDRAVRNVEEFGLEGDVEKWRNVRQQIHDEVCREGFHRGRQAFTQFYGSEKLDASLLMIPLVGFLPPDDPRVRSTVEAIEVRLVLKGFVQRYNPEKSEDVDGLPPGEGSFLPCSFWLVDCLHLIGREDDARAMFERLLKVLTPTGLLSEEYDTDARRLVGNFPQAFSHISLINSARNLSPKPGPAEHRSQTAVSLA
jgi:GH15 family glucan-1,4-alpha-glucosidase